MPIVFHIFSFFVEDRGMVLNEIKAWAYLRLDQFEYKFAILLICRNKSADGNSRKGGISSRLRQWK